MSVLPKDELRSALGAAEDWAIDALASLVTEDSTLGNESRAQGVMEELFRSLDYKVIREPIRAADIENIAGFSPVDWPLEGKENVVATLERPGAGRSLIFNGHIDVVSPEPTELWASPPYQPRIAEEGGRRWMYGRGAGDMKGGTVSYLWALAALRHLGYEPDAAMMLQSVVEEECTGNGTLSLLAKGYRADACIIPEPFHQTILTSQVGVMWFEIRVLGKTTHVLGAGRGVNAIEKSWPIIQALRAYEERINASSDRPVDFAKVEHPLNMNVGVIEGGDWASTVAGECRVRFRIGCYPAQELKRIQKEIETVVAEVTSSDKWLQAYPPEVRYVGFQAEGCRFDVESDLGKTLREAHEFCCGAPPKSLASTATTDVRFFNLYYDIPATCYGPKAENIHGVDERVDLDSVEEVALVLANFVGRWCGLRKISS